ncbi:hypothetical protein G5I_12128 [Acromyrmex echinatior]|uniref:Uncharacterized protein n=1 Tax=Acromyrmex echinatior TaxID=103372 RepID=F4X1D1_ACREC|nr:hypothetical protein G5I_12128 [Acromyrmex echinatior]
MALYNDKDTPGRLGAFRSTKGAALGSSYRTGTCFVRRGQMSPIMFSGACGRKSQNNSRTENTVVKSSAARNCVWCSIARFSALLNIHVRRRSEKQKDRKKEKIVEAVRWFRDESSRNIGHPGTGDMELRCERDDDVDSSRAKPLKNSDNTSPGSGAHLNMHPHRTNNFGERIGESAIRRRVKREGERSDVRDVARCPRLWHRRSRVGHPPNFLPHIMNGQRAQAGLSMPWHVLDRASYDIWVAQKPPMLIDRPR